MSSSTSSSGGIEEPVTQAPSPPLYIDARRELAERFVFGEGIEIGPLHLPLRMHPLARVRTVDRMREDELRREYPELADWDLTPVDIVDDGEKLATIEPESQDFIVANHFLEHTEDPIRTIETHLGKLRPGGILFYAVPDKRYTFDFRRSPTPLAHMVTDYVDGPAGSRSGHYDEWARLVAAMDTPPGEAREEAGEADWAEQKARELEGAAYSIHMHVWTQAEFLRLILECRERFDDAFDIEAAARQGIEFMVVLRKRGTFPAPPPAPGAIVPTAASAARVNSPRQRARRALRAAKQAFRPIEVPGG